MTEYVVDFGDKSSAFVGLAMAEAESHGATLKERVVRCRDCEYARHHHPFYMGKRSKVEEWYCQWHSNLEGASEIEPDGFCAWGERKDA